MPNALLHSASDMPPVTSAVSRVLTGLVPVMPATLLQLELLLDQPSLDLRSVSRLLEADPGALLQLFAVAAEEGALCSDPPIRIEDCIASLPFDRLLHRLICSGRLKRDQVRAAAFTQHARAIGHRARTVAESLAVSGEQAVLIGMLHEIGSLPYALGWQSLPFTAAETACCCEQICSAYSLPMWLSAALLDLHLGRSTSLWSTIIAAAHELEDQHVIPR